MRSLPIRLPAVQSSSTPASRLPLPERTGHIQRQAQAFVTSPGKQTPPRRCRSLRCFAQAKQDTDKGAMPGESTSRVLVTFDVDGTLVHSVGLESNKLHKRAFSHAFKEVFGIEGTIDAIKHHGSTDKLVCMNTLEFYGIPKEVSEPKLDEITNAMLSYAREHAKEGNAAEGLELLPGVLNLLQGLKSLQPEVVVGLVTGNLEEIAWLKMSGLGILDLFSKPYLGGFGSDHVDRGELVKIAAVRARERIPGPPFRLHVHVGDTPNDILAAQYGGARPLGVCTGIFSRQELQSVVDRGDAVILDSLEDMSQVLKACNLTKEDVAATV